MYIDPIQNHVDSNELNHHGILGMKWGVRRFQRYPDGHKGGKEVGEAAKQKPRKPKKIQKDIEKQVYDYYQKIAEANYVYYNGSKLVDKLDKSRIKDSKKGKTSNKTRKLQAEVDKMQARLNSITGSYDEPQEKIKKLLKEAKVGGYKIENFRKDLTISTRELYIKYNDVPAYKISKNK